MPVPNFTNVRTLAQLPHAAAPLAVHAIDDAALAATRARLGAGTADDLVIDAMRFDLDHIARGVIDEDHIRGLHLASGPGRVGPLKVTHINKKRRVLDVAPDPNVTWRARITSKGLSSKHSTMFPTSWTLADVIDGARHIKGGQAIGKHRPHHDIDSYLFDGTWRGIDIRVAWDRTKDHVMTAYPLKPGQVATS